jgi:hypothetical protein
MGSSDFQEEEKRIANTSVDESRQSTQSTQGSITRRRFFHDVSVTSVTLAFLPRVQDLLAQERQAVYHNPILVAAASRR